MSTRERVRLHGVISGQGHEAKCTVLATKVTLEPSGPVAYAAYSVERASQALPEGDYQLFISNGELSVGGSKADTGCLAN
ncbi:hypothetical protein GCM10010987_31190 [Bradyrhizobium guangdongense]|uniref:Uncharacterized protein n=1 Tax=Bradyrhizobium guangdongense TaxID=1325090 RepID=A0A410VDG2_9BRAD|nr:hypothetical protein X265_31815 [Bradyrhizobium guangdongense]QOZ62820.1 hypothetical protein XH86_31850 [Bradyrhizobium guangdongense]GGI24798.1 hypothetical protein GCM10010987_31190 [Bradyrhizobium guangdongense]